MRTFLTKQAELIASIRPQPNWAFNSFEELILNCGKEMSYQPLSENIKLGLPRQCYLNCLRLMDDNPELIYCEGYGLNDNSILPVPHAWLIDSLDRVIDPTWTTSAVYLGVAFNSNWLFNLFDTRCQNNHDNYLAVFEGNYQENYSLLKKGLPSKATIL